MEKLNSIYRAVGNNKPDDLQNKGFKKLVRREKQVKKDDKKKEDRFIDEKSSAIKFNRRVLFESQRPENPIMERLNFLTICESNLDEFISTKMKGNDCRTELIELTNELEDQYDLLVKELSMEYGIQIINDASNLRNYDAYNDLKNYFNKNIYPVLQPLLIANRTVMPTINTGEIILISKFDDGFNGVSCIIKIPDNIPRLIKIPGMGKTFIPVESVILEFIYLFYKSRRIIKNEIIRIFRRVDSVEVDEQNETFLSFMAYVNAETEARKTNPVVLCDSSNEHNAVRMFGSPKIRPRRYPGGLLFLRELKDEINKKDLYYRKKKEFIPIDFLGEDMFETITNNDILVHFPYESFDLSTTRLLQQAAKDPDVLAIKQTLYRVSEDSQIMKALIEATQCGKEVTVLIELKAKFDEENNIRWAKKLVDAGANVIFGPLSLKTHSKVCLIIRKEGDHLVKYCNIATGNFNNKTAKIYEDLSLFTKDNDICDDVASLFMVLGGYSEQHKTKAILLSPSNMRKKFIKEINKCIENPEGASITFKCNALTDEKMILKLYEASTKGVKIQGIVRGMCSLKPGIPGLSENIMIKSVVGRFLEHSRIYKFSYIDKASSNEVTRTFIGSADWMERNLDKRVEVVVPIKDNTIKCELSDILDMYLRDNTNSHTLNSDGSYTLPQYSPFDGGNKEAYSVHNSFMQNYKELQKTVLG